MFLLAVLGIFHLSGANQIDLHLIGLLDFAWEGSDGKEIASSISMALEDIKELNVFPYFQLKVHIGDTKVS